MGARRKPDARWSAAFSTKRRTAGSTPTALPEGPGAADDELRKALWGADRISFHWRYDRRSALPAGLEDAIAFRRLLAAAIVADLPADDRGHPLEAGTPRRLAAPEPQASDNVVELTPRPPTPTDTTGGPIASVARIGATAPNEEPGPMSGLAGLRAQVASTTWDHMSREVTPLEDFDALATWQMADLQASASKRHTPRAGSTLGGYEGDLRLASKFFRYLPGDARLSDSSIGAHESMRLNRSDGIGLTTEDCIGFVEQRKATNLRTRTANLRAEQKWGRAVEAAERAAAYPGAPVDLPPAPISAAETTGPATVKSACGTVKTAFASAVAEGRLDTDPWTARVDKLIVSAPPTHFTDKQLWSPDQVTSMATAMASHERRGTYRNGVAQTLDGGRYRGMIELGYNAYLRPEEVIAARLDWAVLDGPNPFIIIHGAEVNYPLRFTGADTARQFVSLKARNAGDTRLVPLTLEGAAALKVAEPARDLSPTERLEAQQWSKAGSAAQAAPSKAERRAEAKARGYEGDMCTECSNFTLVRNGTCMKCDTCGSTTGCS